jgi:hypothetical protein
MGTDFIDSLNIKWICQCCGVEQVGLPMAMAYKEPHNWLGTESEVKEKSFLNEDFCIINHKDGQVERYIRCVLPCNVINLDETFEFGVWMSVSERSMKLYEAGFSSGKYDEPDCFGFLMHNLPGYNDTWALECTIVFESENQCPSVYLNKSDHELYADQTEGISIQYIGTLFEH